MVMHIKLLYSENTPIFPITLSGWKCSENFEYLTILFREYLASLCQSSKVPETLNSSTKFI